MNYQATGLVGLDAFTITTGTKVPFVYDASTPGCTLGVSTYYFPFGTERSGSPVETSMQGLQLKWAAAVAGTATIEVCNYPATLGAGQGGPVFTDWDSGATALGAGWSLLDPTQAGAVYAVAAGINNTMTKYTATLGGTNAGLAAWNIPEFGWRRGRIKLVLTTGGLVWCAPVSGKLGA